MPLTLLENWVEQRAGIEPYQGGFLLHYLGRAAYPDIRASFLVTAGVIVCMLKSRVLGELDVARKEGSRQWVMHRFYLHKSSISPLRESGICGPGDNVGHLSSVKVGTCLAVRHWAQILSPLFRCEVAIGHRASPLPPCTDIKVPQEDE